MKIREVIAYDFQRLTEYYLSFYEELEDDPFFGLTLANERPGMTENLEWFADFQRKSEKGDAIGLVAEVEGELVGFCEVIRRRSDSPVSHRGELGLSVKKEYRGRGIGSALMKEMIGRCKGKFEILELDVFVGNRRAKHLYEKFGFSTTGILPRAVKWDGKYVDEEIMYLNL